MSEQATCQHENWDLSRNQCADCGTTDEQLRDVAEEAGPLQHSFTDEMLHGDETVTEIASRLRTIEIHPRGWGKGAGHERT